MLSILIPSKEEPYLQELVNQINKVVKEKHEIIIVDKSRILPTIKGAKVIKQKSDSLGNAVFEGVKIVSGDKIVVMDADGTHRPRDISRLVKWLEKYPIVIGSRYYKHGRSEMSLFRRIVSRLASRLVKFCLGLKVNDPLSGFVAARREVFEGINPNYTIGFKFGLILITPERKAGKSKANFKEIYRLLRLVYKLNIKRT